MKRIELTSKFVLTALIATVVFSAITVPAAVAQSSSSPPIRDNSVTSAKIKDGEVKTADIANDAVTSPKIKNGEVKAEDIADGVIPPSGDVELSVQIVSDSIQIPPNTLTGFSVDCPSGTILTGGGFSHSGAGTNIQIVESAPVDENTWQVFGANKNTASAFFLGAFALCTDLSQP